MIRLAAGYATTALTMLALDGVWLTLAVPRLYQPRIGELLAAKPSLAPAVVFYLMYVTAIVVLAIHAVVFGLVAYATYDLTNQATLKTWSTTITLVDMAWGSLVTTAAASAGYAVMRAMGR
jgi:uncharacterized membrane protein